MDGLEEFQVVMFANSRIINIACLLFLNIMSSGGRTVAARK